ncbi:MAG: hypothetical protein CSB48_11015 [Proteobacteria bacterium]|nr:MAG: hypothetical protein CSB48_11015 [Pseudomonadota bacterium]PIE40068.1 MAG: hypothetical protein CSA51_02775 [Gammaproteobacteria bacterium]
MNPSTTISSTTPGRVRIRTARLRSKRFAAETENKVSRLEGVTDVRCNLRSGSLVVNFDPKIIDELAMEEKLESICTRRKPSPTDKKLRARVNQISKIGMATTLTSSVAFAFAGKKKLHLYTGNAFLFFAAIHMLRYKKTLFR